MRVFLTFIIISLTMSCALQIPATQKMEKKARKHLGTAELEHIYNSDSTYVICKTITEKSAQTPIVQTKFIIYHIQEDAVLHEASIYGGYVKWQSIYRVEYAGTPGIEKSSDKPGVVPKVFDLKKGLL